MEQSGVVLCILYVSIMGLQLLLYVVMNELQFVIFYVVMNALLFCLLCYGNCFLDHLCSYVGQ